MEETLDKILEVLQDIHTDLMEIHGELQDQTEKLDAIATNTI